MSEIAIREFQPERIGTIARLHGGTSCGGHHAEILTLSNRRCFALPLGKRRDGSGKQRARDIRIATPYQHHRPISPFTCRPDQGRKLAEVLSSWSAPEAGQGERVQLLALAAKHATIARPFARVTQLAQQMRPRVGMSNFPVYRWGYCYRDSASF